MFGGGREREHNFWMFTELIDKQEQVGKEGDHRWSLGYNYTEEEFINTPHVGEGRAILRYSCMYYLKQKIKRKLREKKVGNIEYSCLYYMYM